MRLRQKGMALVTTVVFLIILSIIGITGMRNTVLEQKMSSNMQDLNHAFQLAESGIARAINDPRISNTSNSKAQPLILSYTSVYDSSDEHISLVAETYYRGERVVDGKDKIYTLAGNKEFIFQIRTVGRYNNATSINVQGVSKLAPN